LIQAFYLTNLGCKNRVLIKNKKPSFEISKLGFLSALFFIL